MKMKAQKTESLEYTKRGHQMIAQHAVRNIYDAFEELITNCDTSYHHMNDKNGGILIEVGHRYKGKSKVIVRDRAEGMTFEEMREKIKKVGDRTSQEGDRGFMGRGAKDCAVLGDVTFESIKDDKYHKCQVLHTMDFVPYKPSVRATEEIRNRLSIPRENGTVVTIEGINKKVPRHETLLSDLPQHYALRDIMRKDSGRKIFLKDLNRNLHDRLIYDNPTGEIVVDEEFKVPDYPSASAHILIYRAEERLEDPLDKQFRRTGILIKGERAIHEVTLFTSEFENDSYAQYYFGKLTCPFIDKLCKEYDERREKGTPHPESNPDLLIDPLRRTGLNKDHPFTKALFRIPTERLRTLIAKDKEKEREKHIQIENEQTIKRLKKLAKAASKFIQDKIEEIEEFTGTGNGPESKEFTKKGVLIIPTPYTLAIGEIKTFGFRAQKREDITEGETAKVTCDNDGVDVITPEFRLSQSRSSEGILTGSFKVKGIHKIDSACLLVTYNGFPPAKASLSVVESKEEVIEIPGGLAFEKKSYRVREGKKKKLLLRAKYPSVVADETRIEVTCKCKEEGIVIVKPQARLRPIGGTNYAEGYVTVHGRKVGEKGKITAKVHGYTTQTEVKVTSFIEEGVPIDIKIRPEDYGNFRAKWDRDHGNPNLLLISATHPSVKRYLGPSPDFEGQDTPHFKLLLAEIVSESVSRKILEILVREVSWEYENLTADKFYYHHNKLMKEFTPIAHEVQLSKQELEFLK